MKREDIVAAARGWIGTPYRHQASLKGAGCDCLGLVRGVWREMVGPEPVAEHGDDLTDEGASGRVRGLRLGHPTTVRPGRRRRNPMSWQPGVSTRVGQPASRSMRRMASYGACPLASLSK